MRTTIFDIQNKKQRGERFATITAYDYTSARIADQVGIPLILVGDSLGMVVQGHSSTLPVTLDEMIYHMRAVMRGAQQALVVGDMPFLTYTSVAQAIATAGRMMQEGGVQAVKLEGGAAVVPIVQRLVELGIPVVAHLGFTPQSVNQIGMRVQGRQADVARQLIQDALALQAAGAFAVVLELIPTTLAQVITERLHIPTIGIGAGPHCDGQIQVWHDLIGLFTDFVPRHTRRYATVAESISTALQAYQADVQAGAFPTNEHSSTMKADELATALASLTQD